MAKTKISEFDANPANNTDIDGINLAEGMAPGLVNNAIRELMAQLKDLQVGSSGDNWNVGGNLDVTGNGQVDGNFNVTGNFTISGSPIDTQQFPSGTKMLFQQTSAPTGWTKDTAHDNKALRIVSGTAGNGGSVNFTTAFASQNVGGTALSTSQIPSHTHSFSGSGSTGGAGSHAHSGSTNTAGSHAHAVSGVNVSSGAGSFQGNSLGAIYTDVNTNAAGSHSHSLSINAVGDHTHSVSVSGTIGATGSGATHTHSFNIAVQYVDVIVATKD